MSTSGPIVESFALRSFPPQQGFIAIPCAEQSWYAVFTAPRHEKAVLGHLEMFGIEAFLPTYEVTRLWKNRQRKTMGVPLFPCYLFVRTTNCYGMIRRTPGVLQLVGNHRGPVPIPDPAIELLRASVAEKKIQPYRELVVGSRVRVKNGPMQGVEGVLVRKDNGWRFVLNIESINQCAAIKVDAEDLEPVR